MFTLATFQKKVQTISFSLLAGSFVYIIGLLIFQAKVLSGLAAPAETYVSFGAINLIKLAKAPIDGGFAATFELLPGFTSFILLVLLLLATVLGLVYIVARRTPRDS